MPSATGTGGGGALSRRHRTSRTPRIARTLFAVFAVGCVALTAAAADPSGLAPPAPSDVFAAGEGGLGRLDTGPGTQGADGTRAGSGSSSSASSVPDADPEGLDAYVDPFAGPAELGGVGEVFLASGVPSGLASGDIPAATLRAYRAAAQVLAREQPGCAIDWALLAGIGRVESDHGRFGGATVTADGRSVPAILGVRLDGSLAGTMVIRDTDGGALDADVEYDRALGPMQFLPGTWQRWGSDGDRDGAEDPQDIDDAALAAARYLCGGAGGLDQPGPAAAAVRRYNNSTEYVQLVLATAAGYRDGGPAAYPDAGYGEPAYPTSESYPGGPGWTPPPASAVGGTPGAGTPGPVFVPGSGATPTTVTPPSTASPTRSSAPVPSTTRRPAKPPATSAAPTTAVPTTAAPTTAAPTTAAPTTAAPTTAAPTTAAPTTAAPTTASPSNSPTPSGDPTTPPGSEPPTCEPVPSVEPSMTVGTDPSVEPCDPPCTEPDPSPSLPPTDAEPGRPGCEDLPTPPEPAGTSTAPPVG